MSTALVTGASSGIGMDIARVLAGQKQHLILVARRKERLAELATELEQKEGIKVCVLDCDLSEREQLNALLPRADEWLTAHDLRLTSLVNNAGTGFWAYFEEQDPEFCQKDVDLNITALTTLTHGFITRAKQHGEHSRILNVASVAGLLPTPRYAVYSSTKAYVVNFTKILSYELKRGGHNISITAMCPGGVLTEFMAQSGQTLKNETGMMKSADVARMGVTAMNQGKLIFVPGLMNKAATLLRFLPDPIRGFLVERSMEVTVKATGS